MSTQPTQPTKPDTKPEKKTDTTTVLSPEELRAISGGAGAPAGGGVNGGVQPKTSTLKP